MLRRLRIPRVTALVRRIESIGGLSRQGVIATSRWVQDHPLPSAWQWNAHLRLGLCGDWIEGPGFASAQGAISSGDVLAQQMLGCDGSMAGGAGE